MKEIAKKQSSKKKWLLVVGKRKKKRMELIKICWCEKKRCIVFEKQKI